MSTFTARNGIRTLLRAWPLLATGVPLIFVGCGSTEQSMEEWETQPAVSSNAVLEYRIDSLHNENRKLKDQVDAVVTENRKLTARNAELETKQTEATPVVTKSEPAPVVNAMVTTEGYDNALQLFRDRKYGDALRSFEGVLTSGVDQALADNCRYWIGESYYGLRQYRDAITQFRTVLELQRSGKKADAQFMIGNAYLALGDKTSARAAFEKVISDYPVSPLAERAKAKLARLR
jgi:tol-pal system protein YbgF